MPAFKPIQVSRFLIFQRFFLMILCGKKKTNDTTAPKNVFLVYEDEVQKKRDKCFSGFLQQMIFKCLAFSVFILMILDSNMHRCIVLHKTWRLEE